MSRGTASFRQADLVKALKAAKAAGVEVARITVKDGQITMEFVTTDGSKEPLTPLDRWLAQHGVR